MKKSVFLITVAILLSTNIFAQQGVSITEDNSEADPSAILDVKSEDKGILIPRMTVANRLAIDSPAEGLMVYQTDDVAGFYYFDGTNWTSVGNTAREYAVYEDQKPSGTQGGAFGSGDWVTRELNTTTAFVGTSISRTGNIITLQPGTYKITASAPAYKIQSHQIRLQNITNNTTIMIGTSTMSDNQDGSESDTRSFVEGFLVVETSQNYEIQHRATTNYNQGYSLGISASRGINEVYTRIIIEKIR